MLKTFYVYSKCCNRSMSLKPSLLLSAENQKKCMQKFQAMVVQQGSKSVVKRAAVLIPIIVRNNEVSLLYTVRAASLKSHRGQVSFPGGMVDKTDASPKETALRETEEEIGISRDDIEVWGTGLPIIRRDMSISTVVGCIKDRTDLNNIKMNPNEVDDIFTVQVKDLINVNYHRHTQFRNTYTTPTYLGATHRIWGLTAVITFMFLKALVPPELYEYQVNYIPDVLKIIDKRNKAQRT